MEFIEVMKQLARMANACNGKCDKCRLDNSALCTGSWCSGNTESIVEAEQIVMQWAAENPEPVYPAWRDWLRSQYPMMGPYTMTDILESHIPADLAEKLGIEPKEDV